MLTQHGVKLLEGADFAVDSIPAEITDKAGAPLAVHHVRLHLLVVQLVLKLLGYGLNVRTFHQGAQVVALGRAVFRI